LKKPLRVLFLASEADPIVKVGGLGDVAGSLPFALQNISHEIDIRLAIPFYGQISRHDYLIEKLCSFTIPYRGKTVTAEAFTLALSGLIVYLIGGELFPSAAPIYTADHYADGLKFAFFSLAVLELTRQVNWAPDIVHANDWHTAPAIYALSRLGAERNFFSGSSSVLGLHNLAYLGHGAGRVLSDFGLPPASDSTLPKWAQEMPLPLGLLAADQIVAVSPTYAREILTPEYGMGLHDFLNTRSKNISGVLNGLDLERWNPKTDPTLEANFDVHELEARSANKSALQSEIGLDQSPRAPLLAMVSRLDRQKGVDLLPEALSQLMITPTYSSRSWQMIILGTGDPHLEKMLLQLQLEFPRRVRIINKFDVALSRRIYAGADVLAIPSRFEPCGLTQMIAMRYGCIPVARATGGLKDTVTDFDRSTDSVGFLFNDASPCALAEALGRAMYVYQDPAAWQGLQQRGMERDFSWTRSAQKYLELYLELTSRRIEQ
jgi:starch synthase